MILVEFVSSETFVALRLEISKLISHGFSPFIAQPLTFTGNGISSEYDPTSFVSKSIRTQVIV